LAYSFHGEGLLIDGFTTTIVSGFLRLFYPFRGFGTASIVCFFIPDKADSSLTVDSGKGATPEPAVAAAMAATTAPIP
jgi:hypothetical protein